MDNIIFCSGVSAYIIVGLTIWILLYRYYNDGTIVNKYKLDDFDIGFFACVVIAFWPVAIVVGIILFIIYIVALVTFVLGGMPKSNSNKE